MVEFVLMLPVLVFVLLTIIEVVFYLISADLFLFASYSSQRVFSIWPEENRISLALLEMKRLMPAAKLDLKTDESLKVLADVKNPVSFFSGDFTFKKDYPLFSLVKDSCEEEDNPYPLKEKKKCF